MKKSNALSAALISTLLLLLAPFHPTATEEIVSHREGSKQTNRNLSNLLGLWDKTLLQRSYWKTKTKRMNITHREIKRTNLPQQQSALKWGLRKLQPGFTPSSHTGKLPSPVLPWLTQCLPQVINQWFRLWFNSSHTPHNISYVKRHYVLCICLF